MERKAKKKKIYVLEGKIKLSEKEKVEERE